MGVLLNNTYTLCIIVKNLHDIAMMQNIEAQTLK